MNVHHAIRPVDAPKKRKTGRTSQESSKRKKVKILFVASEGLPFSKTGGLADVLEALPRALAALGHAVTVLLPRYRNTPGAAVTLTRLTIPMGDGLRFPAIVDGGQSHGVRYYFVDD